MLFDTRWIGRHGIGRFAAEVGARLGEVEPFVAKRSPASPLDPLLTGAWLRQRGGSGGFFTPGFNAPLCGSRPMAFVLHDLIHIEDPGSTSPAKRAFYSAFVRPAVHRASVVLTVSEFSRRRIAAWAGTSVERIVCVGNGVSNAFVADGPRFRHRSRYFLVVSNGKPHKNELRVVEAFARVARGHRDLDLAFSGAPVESVRRLAASLGCLDRIVALGSLDDEALAAAYRGAEALVLASTYEGFGLPAAEAMACGALVVASSGTSVEEVVGDAALLVDPHSVDSIAQGMMHVAESRSSLDAVAARGLTRACGFTWDRTAERLRAALNESGVLR